MNPLDIIFGSISTLTGGLVTDITTAIMAMVAIGFILMGLDYIKDVLGDKIQDMSINASLKRARDYKAFASQAAANRDEVMSDYYNRRYRAEIRRASR